MKTRHNVTTRKARAIWALIFDRKCWCVNFVLGLTLLAVKVEMRKERAGLSPGENCESTYPRFLIDLLLRRHGCKSSPRLHMHQRRVEAAMGFPWSNLLRSFKESAHAQMAGSSMATGCQKYISGPDIVAPQPNSEVSQKCCCGWNKLRANNGALLGSRWWWKFMYGKQSTNRMVIELFLAKRLEQ